MVSHPLTPDVQISLDDARKNGMLNSAMEVMGLEVSSQEDNILSGLEFILSKVEAIGDATYLPESTITGAGDIERKAEGHLRVGYPTRGRRIILDTPVDWASFNDSSRNVRYKVQSLLACDGILRADSANNNVRWYKAGLKFVRDWVSNFIVKGVEDDYAWYDMAVGQRATKLAYVIWRAIENEEDFRYMAPMIVAADIHIQELMNMEKIALHSNHGLFQMAGLLALGRSLPFLARSEEAIGFAMKNIKDMLRGHFFGDGLHKEHSPIYHIFMTNYIHALLHSGFVGEDEQFLELSKMSLEAASWLVQPDETVLPFGDTPPVPVRDRANFAVNRIHGRAAPPFGLRKFEKSGLVIHSSHDENGNASDYLAFSGGFNSRQHKHADDMGFQLFYKGQGIFTDAGTYTYQYDAEERIFIESTRAHNCLEIDGHDYSRFLADAFGSSVDIATEVGSCIVLEASINRERLVPSHLPYNEVSTKDCIPVRIKQKRTIVYHPNRYFIVIDDLKSRDEHEYIQWFNLFPGLILSKSGPELVISNAQEVLAIVKPMIPEDSDIRMHSGQESPRLQGWVSVNGFSLEKTNSFGLASRGKTGIIATMVDLDFHKTNRARLNVGSGGKYVRIVVDRYDGRHEFVERQKKDSVILQYKDPESDSTVELGIGD